MNAIISQLIVVSINLSWSARNVIVEHAYYMNTYDARNAFIAHNIHFILTIFLYCLCY